MDPVEQTPEGVQDPAPTLEPAAPAPSGPWAKDLESSFEDPAVRSQVDAFLRATVQPYSTQLEQKIAELGPAQQLYADLVENPADTYVALTEELFGEDATKAIQDQLTNLFGEEDPTVTEPIDTPPARSAEDQQAIEWAKSEATKQAYNAELTRIKDSEDYQDVPEKDWKLFHPFVAAANGDFDVAAKGFSEWRAQSEPPAPDPEPDPAPPATLGTEAGQTPPPVEKKYTGPGGLESALDDFFAETRPGAPPVVGSV